jgi:hypothetical protein
MNELLQKVLTDKAARTLATLPIVAANNASTFLPWATVE